MIIDFAPTSITAATYTTRALLGKQNDLSLLPSHAGPPTEAEESQESISMEIVLALLSYSATTRNGVVQQSLR